VDSFFQAPFQKTVGAKAMIQLGKRRWDLSHSIWTKDWQRTESGHGLAPYLEDLSLVVHPAQHRHGDSPTNPPIPNSTLIPVKKIKKLAFFCFFRQCSSWKARKKREEDSTVKITA
jgi:hypothetical protein